jgi:transcriptional regulator with XRE-family HTH domain
MRQGELAQRMSELTGEMWTRQMIADLETGRRTFKVDYLIPIARALNVTVEFILLGEGIVADREIARLREQIMGLWTQPRLKVA